MPDQSSIDMNISIVAVILFVGLTIGLLVLFLGGLLLRSDTRRTKTSPAGKEYWRMRLREDSRPLQDLVLEFVRESTPVHDVVSFVGKNADPVPLNVLCSNLPFAPEKVLAAVLISSVVGLVRLTRSGIVLTDSGQLVRDRLDGATIAADKPAVAVHEPQASVVSAQESRIDRKRQLRVVPDAHRRSRSVRLPGDRRTGPFVIGELRRTASLTTGSSNDHCARPGAGAARQVAISAADHRELCSAIAAAKKLGFFTGGTRALQQKLARARITHAGDLPDDLITLNSRAEFVDVQTNERVELAVVYPADADLAAGRISVFHPLGAAMLGHRVGDEFEWPIPYGSRRFMVAAVQFQPEAALALARDCGSRPLSSAPEAATISQTGSLHVANRDDGAIGPRTISVGTSSGSNLADRKRQTVISCAPQMSAAYVAFTRLKERTMHDW